MVKAQTELDMLGAEAMPGGFAEILRILQPAFERALPDSRIVEKRGIRAFFARRRKEQDAVA